MNYESNSMFMASCQEDGEATPRGPNGPRVACNFEDARNFVIICRIDRATSIVEVQQWITWALSQSTHTAAFDTFNRTASAWNLRFARESPTEVQVLITLSWNGRRYVDMDALTFVKEFPRHPPVMNASEIMWLLLSVGAPYFLRSIGISGVRSRIMDELWDSVYSGEKVVHRMNKDWIWESEEPPSESARSSQV